MSEREKDTAFPEFDQRKVTSNFLLLVEYFQLVPFYARRGGVLLVMSAEDAKRFGLVGDPHVIIDRLNEDGGGF